MEHYDCIVIGTGGVGSAALFHLAQHGVHALGIDRFPPGHDRGSSHGDTRLIRLAYMEHPDYVPLLRRAYDLWAQISERCGQQLYTETGLLEVGPPDGAMVPGVLESAREHDLTIEQLTAAEVEHRFPSFRVPETMMAVFEKRAGYLQVEACVLAYLAEAQQLGAALRSNEIVHAWRADGQGVVVTTDTGQYTAERLIITPGAWATQLLGDVGIPFTIRRKSLFWYEVSNPIYNMESGCPCYFYETPEGDFYGFPQVGASGFKVAEHSGGQTMTDPLALDRDVYPDDQQQVEHFLGTYVPGVSQQRQKHVVCMYTVSPDEHFVVDHHPHHPQVAFTAGLSGHGFKFASVLGEILTELALDGQTQLPAEFLSCQRFSRRERREQ